MTWKPFKFNRKPSRRHPIRKTPALRIEELESRVVPSTNVLTYHNDNVSDGENLMETVLTPANVNSTTFGKLFATTVDGQVYAQPLIMTGVNITAGSHQGIHDVVYVATEHDSLFAIDANNGVVLWKVSFLSGSYIPAGATVTTVPNADVNSSDINPEIGITSTPVIDSTTNTLYLTAKTKEIYGGNTHYVYRLHALDVGSGAEKSGAPVVIADTISNDLANYTYVSGPSVKGTGAGNVSGTITLNALRQMNRPGLTLAGGTLYIAFASHGDNGPYHGWVLGYDPATLQLKAVFNTTPNGGLGGIWQAGGRVAVDSAGNLYFETGNGTFDTTLNASGFPVNGDYGDSFVKLAVDPTSTSSNPNINGWGLKVVDYFTPFDQANLNNGDLDLGSGACMLLPNSVGSTAHPQLMVGAGKEGRIYLIDRSNMGHFDPSTDHVVQETNNTTISGSFDTPAYFNGTIYYVGGSNIGNPNDVGKTFSIANGMLSFSPTSQGPDSYAYPGSTPSISANGTTNGVVWDVDTGTNQLRAYNASGYNLELYTSGQAAGNRDQLVGSVVKFSVPTVANGMVYVGTSSALTVYGLIGQPTQAPAAPSNLVAAAESGTQINLTWTDNSTPPNTASGFHIEQSTDGVNFTQVANANAGATSYLVGGLKVSTTYYYRIRAFNSIGNSAYSNTANATTSSTAPALDFSNGFAGSTNLLTYNGKAIINGIVAQLTDGGTNEAGSFFSTNKVTVSNFSTFFTFQLLNGTNPIADGITFCIQGVGNTALGPTGGGLGYGPDVTGGTGGIPTSIAVKFDLYNNQGEGNDSTGLYTNGAAPTNVGSIDLTSTGIDLHSQHVFDVAMNYDGATLHVTITDASTGGSATQSYSINIPGTVGGNTAYVGFTGGTGGLTAIQDIVTWTFTPTAATPPAAPTNLQATAASGTQVNLTWTNNATNQTGFQIDRATDSGFTQNLVTQTAGASATSFVDGGLTPGTTYYYRVRATNAAGNSAYSNTASVTLPNTPAAPSNLHATLITTNQVDLAWTNNATNATGIEVFRAKGNNNPAIIASLPPTATSLNDTGLVTALTPGTTYTYDVEATNLAGPSGPASLTVTTVTLPPTNLAASAGPGQITLTWTAPTGAVTYNVYRSLTSGGEGTTPFATGLTGTSYTDCCLANNQIYYYEVTAVDPGGESAKSAEASSADLPIHLGVSGPASATAGSAFNVTVTALDQNNVIVTSYKSTVHFTSSDSGAGVVLPADYTYVATDNGSHIFSVTLVTAGSQTVTVTDTPSNGTVKGSATVLINPAAASQFTVTGFPSPTTAGKVGNFTITALDPFGNIATGYTGTVTFSSSDSQATLPANYPFVAADKGVHSFSATLKTAGTQSITAKDTVNTSIKGSQTGITVNPAATSHLGITAPATATAGTAFNITVTALDSYNNTTPSFTGLIHFESTDPLATLPANYTFVASDKGVHTFTNGVTFRTVALQTLRAIDRSNTLIRGSTKVNVTPYVGGPAGRDIVLSSPSSNPGGLGLYSGSLATSSPLKSISASFGLYEGQNLGLNEALHAGILGLLNSSRLPRLSQAGEPSVWDVPLKIIPDWPDM
jgi:fibronectin type 3 domain-containing protein